MTGVIYYGGVEVKNGYVKAPNGKLIGTVTTMPTAAKDLSGCAVLYTGASGTYTPGRVYQCTSSGSAYTWTEVEMLTEEQRSVIDNESLQSGFFFDGATADTSKFQLVAHPTGESSVAVVMKPGTGITFTRNSSDNISVNANVTTITGNAGTATKLATARTVQTNLASTGSASFDGSANITPGVTGILPVANGGTGASSLSSITVGAATKATQDGSGNTITSTYATNTTVNAIKPVVVTGVQCSSWTSDSSYTDFPYKGTITVSGCTSSHVPSVTFDVAQATSGDYCPCSESGTNVVYIWSKKNTTITIPAVVCIKPS